jgi:hypothetical protein
MHVRDSKRLSISLRTGENVTETKKYKIYLFFSSLTQVTKNLSCFERERERENLKKKTGALWRTATTLEPVEKFIGKQLGFHFISHGHRNKLIAT